MENEAIFPESNNDLMYFKPSEIPANTTGAKQDHSPGHIR